MFSAHFLQTNDKLHVNDTLLEDTFWKTAPEPMQLKTKRITQ